jgi:ABC-type transport system substrate-binding protein/methyl-accepting chemotaxis protein
LTFTENLIELSYMEQSLQDTIINKVRAPLGEYNESFRNLLELGREIDKTLEKDTDLLSDIRRKFDSLSAAVELEFEGTSVFDQEIKKTKKLLEQSIARVNESLSVSNRISEDLNHISLSFDKIHSDGVSLDETVKNITMVSDSIEVASRNAGITAFHAGRQGRGFEVIAREMTTLVRSAQEPTRMIPAVSDEIIKGAVDLGHDLLKISNIVYDLKEINNKFSNITDELLALIPNIESGIKDIAESVDSQKALHRLLIMENEKSSSWLGDIYDMARSVAILEISLEAMFRQVNHLRESLINVEDSSSFISMFNSIKIVLERASKRYDISIKDIMSGEIGKFEFQSSERSILQLISESNRFFGVVNNIAHEVKNWLKTNELTSEVLSRGVNLYHEILAILGTLNKKLYTIQEKSGKIENPLQDLKKITERSKLLGLYAGIESARGGEYASSLAVVTEEIKGLSEKTTSFVGNIGEIAKDMSKNFSQLSTYLVKSMSDVEQGVSSLTSAIAILEQNKTVLENLDKLSQEMIESTEKMKIHCNKLSQEIRDLNQDYKNIRSDYMKYSDNINAGRGASEQVLDGLNQYTKDVAGIKRMPKTLIFRQSLEPIILDPANKTDARSHEIIEQVFIGLLSFDSANYLIPGIAETFSVSKDGRVWDFSIKKGVKFHNGDTLTAEDCVRTISRVKEGPNVSFIDYVDDVVALDEHQIRFVLKFPYLPFLANLACGVCDITPKEFSADNPIGTGPYRFVHWHREKEIMLEAFDEFFDGRPPIDRIIVKLIQDSREAVARFRRGEISIMQVSPEIIQEFQPDEILSGPVLSTQYLGINVALDTPFKNKKVRQAMNYAIDKKEFAQVLMEGQAVPAYGVFPPGMYVYNKDLVGYHYDLDEAKRLLKEAGYVGGIDGTFPFDVRDSKIAIRRAEYIKNCLEKIGIKLTLNPLTWRDFLEKGYRGESLLCMKGWVSDNGDPDNFLFPLFHSKSFGRAGNTSFYASKAVDNMIEQARSERNSKRRCQMYRDVEAMIIDDAPWIFLSHGVDTYAVNRRVGGFKVDPFGIIRFRYLWSS